jgi:hypothetical protein
LHRRDIVLINLFHSLSGDSLHLKYRVHCIKRGPSHV